MDHRLRAGSAHAPAPLRPAVTAVLPETVLAFDFGTRRIGVAVGNSLTGGARPLEVIEEEGADRRFGRIGRLIEEWGPQRLVVGRPTLEDGTPGPTTAKAERFTRQLQGRFGLPVDTVDERFSSLEAQSVVGRNAADDAEAAAIILRQYFDEHRHP